MVFFFAIAARNNSHDGGGKANLWAVNVTALCAYVLTAKMDPILIAECAELHAHERLQGDQAEFARLLAFVHARIRFKLIFFRSFGGKNDVDRLAEFGTGAIEEHLQAA